MAPKKSMTGRTKVFRCLFSADFRSEERASATTHEIKVAYRKLAFIVAFHPDRQTTDEARRVATDRFSQISNAYELLSNEQSRADYDNNNNNNNNNISRVSR
jgi:DnaJ-class molecular chaperone